MHEKQGKEPNKEQTVFASTLTYLLSNESGQFGEFSGFNVARILYAITARENALPKSFETLYEIADRSNEVARYHLFSALDEVTGKSQDPRADFVESLGSLITKDINSPDLTINARAVRLAYQIKAWELSSAINQIRMIAAQIYDEDIERWLPLIEEKDNFMSYKERAMRSTSINKDNDESGLPLVFTRFIETLNLEGFDGKKPYQP